MRFEMHHLNAASRRFLQDYEANVAHIRDAASLAARKVAGILEGGDFSIHAVTGRAKSVDSVWAKLREKGYRKPSRQLTDAVGVRIITFYQDDVDKVVHRLRPVLTIDRRRSVDKRRDLGLRNFGYRSVHLIGRIPDALLWGTERDLLAGRWVEIQIRSLLEHAWAEIEHSVVYKSGVEYPKTILRLFAALAGALELLERDFLGLRGVRDGLALRHQEEYRHGSHMDDPLDVSRMIGYMESRFPEGVGWLRKEQRGGILPPGLARACLTALSAIGVGNATSLAQLLRGRPFREAVRSFAAARNLTPAQVSHLALIVLAIAAEKPKVLRDHFPDLIHEPTMQAFVARRIRTEERRRR